MDSDIAIKVDNVSKSFKLPHQKVGSIKHLVTNPLRAKRTFEMQHALKNIDLEIKKGEFFGIVGRNGSGKSTLLKILAGIYQPTKGKVQVHGKLVPFIELGVGFNPELTGRENVYLNGALLGFSEKEVAAMYDDIVEFAELEKFMDQKLKNYSSGMQVRLAFSMATRSQADILLIDEVLAVGDADFQRKCFDYFKQLKKAKKTVVFVSHDMNAIREFCDTVALIEGGSNNLVGEPSVIAKEYSKLFLNDTSSPELPGSQQRWGTGDAQADDVSAKITGDQIIVEATVTIMVPNIDKLIYGIHITSSDGQEIMATNNQMVEAPDIENINSSSKVRISWKMLNIFSDGKYYVTLTLIDQNQTPLDWYTDATSFIVKRPHRSTTAVLPPIEGEYYLINKTRHNEKR